MVPPIVFGGGDADVPDAPRTVTIRVTDAPPGAPPHHEPAPPVDEVSDPWSRPETMPSRSANAVMLWLLIPFVGILLYGLLVR